MRSDLYGSLALIPSPFDPLRRRFSLGPTGAPTRPRGGHGFAQSDTPCANREEIAAERVLLVAIIPNAGPGACVWSLVIPPNLNQVIGNGLQVAACARLAHSGTRGLSNLVSLLSVVSPCLSPCDFLPSFKILTRTPGFQNLHTHTRTTHETHHAHTTHVPNTHTCTPGFHTSVSRLFSSYHRGLHASAASAAILPGRRAEQSYICITHMRF